MEHNEISANDEKEIIVQCSEVTDEGGIPVSDEEDNNLLEVDQIQSHQSEVPTEKTQNDPLAAPINVVDEMSVAGEISKYIHSNRINVSELETLNDMWEVCDAISAAHSGLPDSLLREAFLLVLEGLYSWAQNNPWMRKHLDKISRMWKLEMVSGRSISRPTKFVSSSAQIVPTKETAADEKLLPTENAAQHSPVHPLGEEEENAQKMPGDGDTDALPTSDESSILKSRRQRRQVAKRKRALAVMMGVGQMLKQARRTLDTETGQLDVDEDEFGNFSIGGTELTFESWGKLNAIQQDDVVNIDGQHQQQTTEKQRGDGNVSKQQNGGHFQAEEKAVEHKTEVKKLRQPVTDNVSAEPMSNRVKRSQKGSNRAPPTTLLGGMAQRYPTVAEVEMPSPVDEAQNLRPAAALKMSAKKERKAARIERKQKRIEEKDEGELSSSDSEEPTSSEEEEDMARFADETPRQSTDRLVVPRGRRMHRVNEQKQGVSSAQNLQALLRKCFELRTRIVGKLSIGQKAMFRDCLNKSIAGTLQQQPQQNQLQQLFQSVANGGGGISYPLMTNM